ncbi:MAG: histidinol-phosphatase HisJ family protein [Bacillota bacterium]|nr:histidinol-phosphatase HisJ family protein [Bacillota bacterium]
MFDYHVHTRFSPDARMSMLAACRRALEIGLTEISFTDHLDYYYPGSPLKWEFEYRDYAREIERCAESAGGGLRVLKAVELGLHPAANERNAAFIKTHAFDFVIGSVHIVGDKDLDNGRFFVGRSLGEAGRLYLEAVNRNVRAFPHFNVLGHADLFKRYLHFLSCRPEDIDWSLYWDIVEDTFKVLIASGRGIEVNTSGYRNALRCTYPGLELLKLYRRLGGEVVTLGSDAHRPEHVGLRFDLGRELLLAAGFRYVAAFRGGRPRFVPLE